MLRDIKKTCPENNDPRLLLVTAESHKRTVKMIVEDESEEEDPRYIEPTIKKFTKYLKKDPSMVNIERFLIQDNTLDEASNSNKDD